MSCLLSFHSNALTSYKIVNLLALGARIGYRTKSYMDKMVLDIVVWTKRYRIKSSINHSRSH